MNKIALITKSLTKTVTQNAPAILTGIGAAGVVVTAVLAVKATNKASQIIRADVFTFDEPSNLTKTETVKLVWKEYVPTVLAGVGAVTCIIGAQVVNVRRQAALMGVITLGEAAFQEYKDEVLETLGTKSADEVHKKIAEKRIAEDPVPTELVVVDDSKQLCYEVLTGRYFLSDKQTIRAAVNDLNEQIINNQYASLNEFYLAVGLATTRLGDDLGWRAGDPNVEAVFSAVLADNGKSALAIDFRQNPHSDYQKIW